MIYLVVTVVMLCVGQILTLMWLFWLDGQYKLLDRYVQGLNGADKYIHPMRDEPGRFA